MKSMTRSAIPMCLSELAILQECELNARMGRGKAAFFAGKGWHRLCLLRSTCRVAEPEMCGIAGIMNLSGRASEHDLKDRVDRMTRRMEHRGPDADGHWRDER